MIRQSLKEGGSMKKVFSVMLIALMAVGVFANGAQESSSTGVPDFSKMNVQCIVPYSAGGGTDQVMRGLADAASSSFKNISVINVTGGSGATGMLQGAHSKPDGSVVTMVTVELVTLEAMGNNAGLTYSMFKPIMLLNTASSAITVRADDPRFKNINDFIDYAKKNEVLVGNSGIGAIWHLAAAGFGKVTGAKLKHVGYDGAAPAITDLLGGHIDAVSVSYSEVSSFVESGDLKVLAVLSDHRLAAIPDVPTVKESGYDVSLGTWRGIAVPASTPDAIVDELYKIFSTAAETEKFKTFMNNTKNVIEIMDGPSFKEKMKNELTLYSDLVKDLGLAVK